MFKMAVTGRNRSTTLPLSQVSVHMMSAALRRSRHLNGTDVALHSRPVSCSACVELRLPKEALPALEIDADRAAAWPHNRHKPVRALRVAGCNKRYC